MKGHLSEKMMMQSGGLNCQPQRQCLYFSTILVRKRVHFFPYGRALTIIRFKQKKNRHFFAPSKENYYPIQQHYLLAPNPTFLPKITTNLIEQSPTNPLTNYLACGSFHHKLIESKQNSNQHHATLSLHLHLLLYTHTHTQQDLAFYKNTSSTKSLRQQPKKTHNSKPIINANPPPKKKKR